MAMTDRNHGLWRHLPVLVRANSKESVEYILQALWRTRKTGLDDADRQIFRQMLQLQNDAELDPVCCLSPSLKIFLIFLVISRTLLQLFVCNYLFACADLFSL